jgi:ferric-dicitrate binding protein FerR (iron transport regulator)
VFRTSKGNVIAATAIVLLVAAGRHVAAGAADDKQLVRIAGTVGFVNAGDDRLFRILGRFSLADDATAVTLAGSRAQVRLADSTEIDIGERTRVRVGAFDALDPTKPNVVSLELGAIHFTVRHAAGERSNYLFQTPTSQIAIRGTDGYIVTGPKGTDFYCVACETGDATITVGTKTYPMITGRQAIVTGSDAATASVDIIDRPCVNPAAIAISDGKLGKTIPPDQWIDTTGALGGDPLRPVAIPTP